MRSLDTSFKSKTRQNKHFLRSKGFPLEAFARWLQPNHLFPKSVTCDLPDVTRIASRRDVASWASALLRPRFLNASRPTDVTCFAEHPLHHTLTSQEGVLGLQLGRRAYAVEHVDWTQAETG